MFQCFAGSSHHAPGESAHGWKMLSIQMQKGYICTSRLV